MASEISPQALKELAPQGVLRVAINFGNSVLVQRDPVTGAGSGVTIDLAREFARRIGVDARLIPFDAAGKVFDALAAGAWDLAFLAIDPVRAAGVDFTAPYVIIEGSYMVRTDSPLRTVEEVDRAGVRICVAKGSAYDLFLTRSIKHAQLLRESTGEESLERFLRDGIEVAAGVKSPLQRFAAARPGLRVMDGRFMAIEQAMGLPKGRSEALKFLRNFIEDMKASGFVAQALTRSGQHDATVAPPAPVHAA